MRKKAEHLFSAFLFKEGLEKKYEAVLKKFKEHFVPKRYTNYSLASMFSSTSTEGQRKCASLYLKPLRTSWTLWIWCTEGRTNLRQDSHWNSEPWHCYTNGMSVRASKSLSRRSSRGQTPGRSRLIERIRGQIPLKHKTK